MTGEYKGLCIDLIKEISEWLGFHYEIYSESKFGTLNKTSMEWDGVVKRLINKEADIGLGPMWVTAERESVVDFTVPFYDLVGFSILIREKKVFQISKFIRVLDVYVWLAFLGIYLLIRYVIVFSLVLYRI